MDTHLRLSHQLADVLEDLSILAGERVGPSGFSWQDVAGTAAVNLRELADSLDSLREGETHHQGCRWDGPVVFPSPAGALESLEPREVA